MKYFSAKYEFITMNSPDYIIFFIQQTFMKSISEYFNELLI